MRLRRFASYAAVGAIGTAVQYATLLLLTQSGITGPVFASCVGAVLGAVVNYGLNHRVTFRSTRRHRSAAWRFFVVAAAAASLNWVVMTLLVTRLGVQYLLAQLAATAAVLALTYTANAGWSFAPRMRTQP